MVYNIQQSNIQAKNGLTIDESSSIALYSMEWSPREKSFYIILNKTLRDPKRETLLPPWFQIFTTLFYWSLETSIDWSSNHFSWSKNGLTKSIQRRWTYGMVGLFFVHENSWRSRKRTICWKEWHKNIIYYWMWHRKRYSWTFILSRRRRNSSFTWPRIRSYFIGLIWEINLTMIHLKEVQPRFPNLPPLPSSNPPVSTSTVSIASGTTVTAKATASAVQPKPTAQPKPSVKPVVVSYGSKNLTDKDIPRVIKEALEQKKCTKLYLATGTKSLTKELHYWAKP